MPPDRRAEAAQAAADRGPEGLLVVDKPAGWTSHDVVAKVRRLAGTRRVGHAGTLDPMATGVLVLGLGRATRLLGYVGGADKAYEATIRLGVTTSTDDAEGEVLQESATGWMVDALHAAMAALTGDIDQVPSAVSAVKVGGVRAYRRVRAGETVELAPRRVRVSAFDLLDVRGDLVDVHVECSTGTYVRALARDVGAALGTGGHLTALRRTRVGRFEHDQAHDLTELIELAVPAGPAGLGVADPRPPLPLLPLAAAVAATVPVLEVDAEAAATLRHGGSVAVPEPSDRAQVGAQVRAQVGAQVGAHGGADGGAEAGHEGGVARGAGHDEVVGVLGPGGGVLALARVVDGWLRPVAVLEPAS